MPRAITKEDIKRIRSAYSDYGFIRIKPHKKLGYIVEIRGVYAYRVFENRYGQLILHLVDKKTIDLRKRIGPAKKRIKQILKDPDFGLEEMALAEAMINDGGR